MPHLTLLQINVDRGREAHDLLIATASDVNADIIMKQEPNGSIVSGSSRWITDTKTDAAIYIRNSDLKVGTAGFGAGFVWVEIAGVDLYSCYFSPSFELSYFERSLEELKNDIVSSGREAVVCGDFNANDPEWGMPSIDLTMATEAISTELINWEVLDNESLSCHRYLKFKFGGQKEVLPQPNKSYTGGWNLNKLNVELFYTTLTQQLDSNIQSADGLIKILTKACDAAMLKKIHRLNRKPTYWWSSEIAQQRRICVSARRAYSRRNLSEDVRNQQRELEYEEVPQTGTAAPAS